MFVDLHAHYAMHLKASSRVTPPRPRETIGDLIRATALYLANKAANFPDRRPAITIARLKVSPMKVVLSPLLLPFDEIDLGVPHDAPPGKTYFEDLEGLMKEVDRTIGSRPDAIIARNWADIQSALETDNIVLVHAVEGGFHVGHTEDEINKNVDILADHGVAYITVAHLFNRHMATCAPAIPFISDGIYRTLFPQKRDEPLTSLGRSLIRAMVRRHILIDVTHMNADAFDATVAQLERIEDDVGQIRSIPIVATHTAFRFGSAQYNISDGQIAEVARRNGVIGLIACTHWMADGLQQPKNRKDTFRIIDAHIDRIHDVTGSHRFTAIGSDLDGFIKPALPGLETPRGFAALGRHLEDVYGTDAEGIRAGNALRLLREYWWGNRPVQDGVVPGKRLT